MLLLLRDVQFGDLLQTKPGGGGGGGGGGVLEMSDCRWRREFHLNSD